MKRMLTSIIILALALSLHGSAFAVITNLAATINGDQANAGVGSGSTATGSATLSYDSDTGELSWDIQWAGLSGPVTSAHFHGAALPNQNAGVQLNWGGISGLNSPSIGSTAIAPAQAADLLNDLWYINIHTGDHPGGEIRGQVAVTGVVANDAASWGGVKALFD